MCVFAVLQVGPGVRTIGQAGMHAAGGPGSSNGDKAMNVRSKLSRFPFASLAVLCMLDHTVLI